MSSQAKSKRTNIFGDTIIEVILCITVLGVVMSVAYISTTHSLQVGTDAGNRNRALGFGQQQLERIKYYEQTGVLAVKLSGQSIGMGQRFCYDPTTDTLIPVSNSTYCTICTNANGTVDKYIDPGSGSCPTTDQSIYSVYMVYNPANIFTTNVRWVAPNGSGYGKLTLYYKSTS